MIYHRVRGITKMPDGRVILDLGEDRAFVHHQRSGFEVEVGDYIFPTAPGDLPRIMRKELMERSSSEQTNGRPDFMGHEHKLEHERQTFGAESGELVLVRWLEALHRVGAMPMEPEDVTDLMTSARLAAVGWVMREDRNTVTLATVARDAPGGIDAHSMITIPKIAIVSVVGLNHATGNPGPEWGD